MFVKRLLILFRRVIAARRLGVRFRGLSSFVLPRSCKLCGTEVQIDAPAELSLRSDFINVLLDDEYGLREISETPLTICDIGGNIGLFSLWARHLFPDATIHCYEPNARVSSQLKNNLDGRDISIFREAVGAKAGFVEMNDSSDSRNARTKANESGSVAQVAMTTAVERLGGKIDLLKLDCEGAEWEIFMAPGSLESVKQIRLEYHLIGGHKSVNEFLSVVDSAGFKCEKILEEHGFGIAWLSKK